MRRYESDTALARRATAYSNSESGGPALSGAQLGGSLAGKLSRDDSSTGSTSVGRGAGSCLGVRASLGCFFFIPQSRQQRARIRPNLPISDHLRLPQRCVQDGPEV